jgi:hypothetical protein
MRSWLVVKEFSPKSNDQNHHQRIPQFGLRPVNKEAELKVLDKSLGSFKRTLLLRKTLLEFRLTRQKAF